MLNNAVPKDAYDRFREALEDATSKGLYPETVGTLMATLCLSFLEGSTIEQALELAAEHLSYLVGKESAA